ncbi:MAG: hypothetical protein QM704_14915 [Anaeromyxobacteraceae bacterium]
MSARPSARRRTPSSFVASGSISPPLPGKTRPEPDASTAARRKGSSSAAMGMASA